MKLCWDNLEKLKYTKYGFKIKSKISRYYYIESKKGCLNCGEIFLELKTKHSKFCSKKCSQSGSFNNFFNKKRPEHSSLMKKNNPMEFIDFSGDKNPNWKGGISINPYCEGWNFLSKEMRDFYKVCQNPNCEGKSNILTTHHIDYDKENCKPENLIVLCHICNGIANGNRVFHETFYKELKSKWKNV